MAFLYNLRLYLEGTNSNIQYEDNLCNQELVHLFPIERKINLGLKGDGLVGEQ